METGKDSLLNLEGLGRSLINKRSRPKRQTRMPAGTRTQIGGRLSLSLSLNFGFLEGSFFLSLEKLGEAERRFLNWLVLVVFLDFDCFFLAIVV